MTRKEQDAILAAAAAIIADRDAEVHETTDEAATRKARPTSQGRKRSTRPSSPKATAARSPKAAPDVWVVKRSWKGQEPRPRMIGAAIYYGCSAAAIEGLDKLDLSKLIGKTRGLRVKVEA